MDDLLFIWSSCPWSCSGTRVAGTWPVPQPRSSPCQGPTFSDSSFLRLTSQKGACLDRCQLYSHDCVVVFHEEGPQDHEWIVSWSCSIATCPAEQLLGVVVSASRRVLSSSQWIEGSVVPSVLRESSSISRTRSPHPCVPVDVTTLLRAPDSSFPLGTLISESRSRP